MNVTDAWVLATQRSVRTWTVTRSWSQIEREIRVTPAQDLTALPCFLLFMKVTMKETGIQERDVTRIQAVIETIDVNIPITSLLYGCLSDTDSLSCHSHSGTGGREISWLTVKSVVSHSTIRR